VSDTQENAAHLDAIYAKIALIAAVTNRPYHRAPAQMKFSNPSDDSTSNSNVVSLIEVVAARRSKGPATR
jgi:hypothetical protein